jgi:hypothetical protein
MTSEKEDNFVLALQCPQFIAMSRGSEGHFHQPRPSSYEGGRHYFSQMHCLTVPVPHSNERQGKFHKESNIGREKKVRRS